MGAGVGASAVGASAVGAAAAGLLTELLSPAGAPSEGGGTRSADIVVGISWESRDGCGCCCPREKMILVVNVFRVYSSLDDAICSSLDDAICTMHRRVS